MTTIPSEGVEPVKLDAKALEACPWCGLTEHLSLRAEGSYTPDMPARPYRVVCNHIDHDTVEGPIGYGRNGATLAWNRRAPVSPSPAIEHMVGSKPWSDVRYLMSVIDTAIEDGFDPDEDGPLLDEIRAELAASPIHYLGDDAKARLPEPAADLIYLLRQERKEAADALDARDATIARLERELDEAREALKPRWSIPRHAKWCQPGDVQDAQRFLVMFEDPDRGNALFTDREQAVAFYTHACTSWNCWLFEAMPATDAARTLGASS